MEREKIFKTLKKGLYDTGLKNYLLIRYTTEFKAMSLNLYSFTFNASGQG